MPGNPPAYATPLQGRCSLVQQVRSTLREAMLVTLVGPGGIGKTHLAAEVARADPAARFVDLGSADDVEQAVAAVAFALGIDGGRTAREGVVDSLVRCPRLVCLDNVDPIEGLPAVIEDWIAACPRVRWLATSRVPLAIRAEVAIRVGPLPPPDEDPIPSAAFRVLADHAPTGALDDVDPKLLRQLLMSLDGVPLALQICGRRLQVVSVQQLAERIERDYFAILDDPSVTRGRHRGLRRVLEQAYSAMSDGDRAALAQASVFLGPFDLRAAEAVLRIEGPVLDAVHRLVATGLLHRVADRFRLLEPVRQLARLHLPDSDHAPTTQRKWRWFARRGRELADAVAAEVVEALDDLGDLVDELRALLDAAAEGRGGSGVGPRRR